MERKHLSAEQANLAIALHQRGDRQVDIADVLETSQSVISRLLSRFREKGATARRHGSGSHRKTTPRQDRLILINARHPFATARQHQDAIQNATGSRISDQTVRNRLLEVGLACYRPLKCPARTPDHRRQRREWTSLRLQEATPWEDMPYTDEYRFYLNNDSRRLRVYRERNHRNLPQYDLPVVVFGGVGVMVCSSSELMEKEKTNIQQIIFDLKAQQSSIDTQMDYIRSERESILKIRKEFETRLKTLTDSNNTLLLDKKLLEEENDRLSKQNDSLTSENTSFVGKINVQSEESVHVQDKILNNNLLIEELNETVENLTDERNKLKNLIETYLEKVIIIENAKNLLEKEKVAIETKLEFTIADNQKLTEKYTARISFLEDEVNALMAEKYLVESKLHIIEADHQKSNETFAIRINFLEDEIKALAAHKHITETKLAATEQELTIEKSAHLKSLQSLEIDRQKMADELTLQNNILQAENNVLGSQIKSRIEDTIKEKKYANELKNELASQNEMVKNLQTENTNNSEDLKNLKTELELKRNEVLKHIENITNARGELEETSKKLETHKKEVIDLKSKLKATDRRLLECLDSESKVRCYIQDRNKKIEKYKGIIKTCVEQLEHVHAIFIEDKASRHVEGRNVTDMLANVKVNLATVESESEIPTSSQITTESTRVLVDLQYKEAELGVVKTQVDEMNKRYNEVSRELQKCHFYSERNIGIIDRLCVVLIRKELNFANGQGNL